MACNLSLVPVVRDDSMSMDSDQDSTDNSVSVTTKLSHVVTDQHLSLATDPYPPVSEPSLQDQANTIPGPTATSDMPKQLDFKALSEAISQFKASKMLVESDAGETSFRVDPHQSFLNLGDQTDSYPQYSSETHSLSATLSEALVSCTSNKIESAVPTMFTGAPLSSASGNAELASSVEASREMVMASGETLCSFKPATPTAVPIIAAENASDILNNPEHWEQSSTSSMDTRSDTPNAGSKVDSGQASNGSSVSENPPMTAVVNTSSFDPPVKNQCGSRGFLPTPGNSRYGMDCFYPALQGSGLISSTPRSMGLNCPRFVSHNGAIGFRHPLLNCTVSNNLAVVGPPVLTGFLPSNNMHMTWNNLAQGSASGLWAARYGLNAQQLHRSQFIQNWQGNPAFQGDSYRPNRGGFGGW